ncbi:MAG: CDP-glucose 4,6-dehydratase [Deltaproteobacteria bacterium]|jgi:CDP-glucose 4,6-dehydratase|nr:CDP-glucose 4,6-dehydratase [Deltaproteobacteria bacterium]
MSSSKNEKKLSDNIWSGRHVLVTGHTGFKGSWLIQWLAHLGAKVHGYALPPEPGPDGHKPLFTAAGLKDLLASHTEGNILDRELFQKTWKDSNASVLFHLAAQALVGDSYREPLETFQVNVLGTASVLETIRLNPRPVAVVIITSDKCYLNQEQVWGYREIDPLGGKDPYSASKAAAEIAAQSWRDSFFPVNSLAKHGVRLATARAGNVIGGGDWAAARLIPDLVRALNRKQAASIRNPQAIRPWQHVLEPLSGYLALAERLINEPLEPLWCSAWNFGPEPKDAWSVSKMADYFCQLWGEGAQWTDNSDPNAPQEAGILRLSIDRARSLLGWAPQWSVKRAVARTASWYQAETRKGFEARKNCLDNILEYIYYKFKIM